MLDYKPNIVLSNEEFNVVGTRPVRPDGAEKVTGRARYGADQNLPGLLYGKDTAQSLIPTPSSSRWIPARQRRCPASTPW